MSLYIVLRVTGILVKWSVDSMTQRYKLTDKKKPRIARPSNKARAEMRIIAKEVIDGKLSARLFYMMGN